MSGRKRGDLEEYLLVDGYNIIFAWDDLRELSEADLAAARGKLADILCDYQGYRKCTLILVFDAYKVEGNPGKVARYHNIHIVYTREAETADQYIEKTVRRISRKHEVTVATSDALEQVIILGQGARRMSAAGLREEVERARKELRAEHLGRGDALRHYLFDHLGEDETEEMERLRLGKEGDLSKQQTGMYKKLPTGHFNATSLVLIYLYHTGKEDMYMEKRNETVVKLAQTALMAALCFVSFTFLQIKIPLPGGDATSFHLGNTFCVLGALILGGWYGGLAGAVGMTIADVLDPVYIVGAPKTFVLKLCIGLITGLVAHRIAKINESTDKKYILRWSTIASVAGLGFNVIADPLAGYFYKQYILGQPQQMAEVLAKWSTATTFVNAVISILLAGVLYNALRPVLLKTGMIHITGQKLHAKWSVELKYTAKRLEK